jgi:hypothetical protein
MLKVKHTCIAIALGYCVDFCGAFLKIMHYGMANTFLTAGLVLKVFGVLLLLTKLLTHPRLKDFINW